MIPVEATAVAYVVSLVSDDGENIAGWNHIGGGSDYVRQQRFASDFVQHLRVFRL